MALKGIPVDYDSDHYAYETQLEELQTLRIQHHYHQKWNDAEEDADALSDDSDSESFAHSMTPSLFDLSDSEQTRRSFTDSIFNDVKYDRMEPLIFGSNSSQTLHSSDDNLNSITFKIESVTRERRDSTSIQVTSPRPQPQPPSMISPPQIESVSHAHVSSKLSHLNQIKLPQTRNEASQTIAVQTDETMHSQREEMNDKIRALMDDIWWLLDSDKELKTYKKTGKEFQSNLLILFESFNSMHNNGDDIYFALCKLLGPQMILFAKSEASRFMDAKQFKSAMKAYNVLIRFCFESDDNLCIYYLKRSECYFRLDEYQEAISDAEESYKLDLNFERGYLMHAKILMMLDEYENAKQIYISGYTLGGKYKKKFSIGIQSATKSIEMKQKSKHLDIKYLELESRNEDTHVIEQEIKYENMTKQIAKDIHMKHTTWNNLNIEVKDAHCLEVQRVMFWMQMYTEWHSRYISYLSYNELMYKICGKTKYEAAALYNDYIHIMDKYMNSTSSNDEFMETFGVCCDKQNCKMHKRHFSDKYAQNVSIEERERKYCGYTESECVAVMQLLDQIHCCFMHFNPFCFDENIYDLFETECDQLLSTKEEEEERMIEVRKLKKNKFILDTDNSSIFPAGTQFVYWPYFKKSTLFCEAKYETLKDEMLHNEIYKMDELLWNNILIKALWIQKSLKGMKGARMKAKDKGAENEKLGIGVGCHISLRHIVVLLIYCNCIQLRNEFYNIENGCNKTMDLQQMRQRNCEIAFFCMFLYEAVLFYGEEMKENEYFYGGICNDEHKLLLNEYALAFKQPISMTTSLNVIVKQMILSANVYENKEVIIVKYGASDSYGCCYFNLRMFCDDPQQKEVLLFNCKLSIYDLLHFDVNYGNETKQILQSNDKYVQSLKFFEKLVNGHFFTSQYDETTQQLYEKIVSKMIDNHLHPQSPSIERSSSSVFNQIVRNMVDKIGIHQNNVNGSQTVNMIEIPPYIQHLFRFYCDNLNEIWLIKSELASLSDEVRSYFISSQSNDVIIDSANRDCYGAFLQMMETNHRESVQTFVNFVNEYMWYIGKNSFHQFMRLKCNESMVGPKVYVQIAYDDNVCNNFHTHVIFEPNCYRSLHNAPAFGAFGLSIKQLPPSIDKIKFEYQVTCKESNYILLVPPTNKWYSKGDNICFKSFKSKVLNQHSTNEFSYRFAIKIVQIHKSN